MRQPKYQLLLARSGYEREMMNLSSRPDLRKVRIATFSLQVGVNSMGSVFSNNWAFNFLKHLAARNRVVDTSIVVGTSGDNMRSVVQNSADVFPTIDWRVHPATHLKTTIFTFKESSVCIFGGRNLASSDWIDLSMKTIDEPTVDQVMNHYDALRAASQKITPQKRITLR